MTPRKSKRWIWIAVPGFIVYTALVLWAAAPSTERVISLATGLKVGGASTDRIGFYNATPTPKPIITVVDAAHIEAALAAQGLIATATPTATSTATATATATATTP
jgi:hypothetical protein